MLTSIFNTKNYENERILTVASGGNAPEFMLLAATSAATTATTTKTATTSLAASMANATSSLSSIRPKVKLPLECGSDGDEDDEKDLTNLAWLTELRNQTISWPKTVPNPLDDDRDEDSFNSSSNNNNNSNNNSNNNNSYSNESFQITTEKPKNIRLNIENIKNHNGTDLSNFVREKKCPTVKRPTPSERYEIFLDKVKRDRDEYNQSAKMYQTSPNAKPPFNYSHIIGMAMLDNGGKVTLQQICAWIEAKFAYFRTRKKWNNSIRHNLSLHYCFRKIDRKKYEKGKGGYWELGVDPRKCDRKRVRNRKSSHVATRARALKENVISSVSTSSTLANSRRKTKTLTASSSTTARRCQDNDMLNHESKIYEVDCSHQRRETRSNAYPINHDDDQLQKQHIFIADIDILPNIVSAMQSDNSTKTIMLNDEQLTTALATISANNGFHFNFKTQTDGSCLTMQGEPPQQFQLGTLISLSSPANSMDHSTITNTQNYSISQNNHHHQQQSCILYNDEDIPAVACENVLSTYLNTECSDANAIVEHEQQQATITSGLCINPNANARKPNVIVEQLEATRPTWTTLMPFKERSSVLDSTVNLPFTTQTADFVNDETNYNCRPNIDSIEEAFQYLRSIDNNRNEDILDNLLDISVCDY